MRFATIALASFAAAANAAVLPRADLGAWNVTFTVAAQNDAEHHSEILNGLYANSALADTIPISCHYTAGVGSCTPDTFSYVLSDAGSDADGRLYQLALTQNVDLSGTETTVKGTSAPFHGVLNINTLAGFTASNVIVEATSAVA